MSYVLSFFCEIVVMWKPQNSNDDVDIGSGNGLVLAGIKPFSEPMLTQLHVTIWCH